MRKLKLVAVGFVLGLALTYVDLTFIVVSSQERLSVTRSSRTPRAETSATSQVGNSAATRKLNSNCASAVRNQSSTPFFQ